MTNEKDDMLPVKDVLIVGAGPTGLLLAGDLAVAGVSCAVLERRDHESNLTRAFGVHARTLELLDIRGVADELVKTGVPIDRLRFLQDIELDFAGLPTRFPYVLITPQYETERVLEERARSLGAEIKAGVEVVGLVQDGDGVDLDVRSSAGGSGRVRARYVVGADGVHSTVRRALGLPFPGRSVVRSVMMCDARLSDPPPDVLRANANGEAFALVVPFGDGWFRVIAWNRDGGRPETEPVELEEIRAAARRALGTDHGLHDARWTSRFHSDERQVPRYRVGRVFLAGDAAHVHSPAGGLGMNTGLQDAANLGWKLAAALRGWADDGLLDSYHDERYPVGRSVVRTSGVLLRSVLARPRALRSARRMAARAVTGMPPVAHRVTGKISGIGLAYPAPRRAHSLTGRRAPDVPLSGNGPRSLFQALRAGRFVLVTPPDAPVPASVTAGWSGRVDVAVAPGWTRAVVLVRPDGYIAWAERDAGLPASAVRTALARWCGPSAGGAAH
jgi:2-polyprenyl-6-methoxyphenol hydroxylase-like FAD-dependent oxidoreductase